MGNRQFLSKSAYLRILLKIFSEGRVKMVMTLMTVRAFVWLLVSH